MLNPAILRALSRPQELGIYVKGALSTGSQSLRFRRCCCTRPFTAAPQRVGKPSWPRTKRSQQTVPSKQRYRLSDRRLGTRKLCCDAVSLRASATSSVRQKYRCGTHNRGAELPSSSSSRDIHISRICMIDVVAARFTSL